MLELKEGDIRAIAQRRYTDKAGKRFWVTLWSMMGLMVVFALAVPKPYNKGGIALIIVFFVLLISYVIRENRFEKAMVADWRRETGQEKPTE